MHTFVLASSSLPHQPTTSAGYGWSLLGGVAFVWLLFSGGKKVASRSSGQASSGSSGSSRSGNGWLWILAAVMVFAAVKSQDGSGTPPAHHSTVVTTPHKSNPTPKKAAPHKSTSDGKSGSSGSSCSLICFHN